MLCSLGFKSPAVLPQPFKSWGDKHASIHPAQNFIFKFMSLECLKKTLRYASNFIHRWEDIRTSPKLRTKSCVLILTSPNSDLPGLKRICRLAFRLLSITAVVADVSGTPQKRGSLCDATTWACRVSGISDSSWFGV